MVEEKIKVKDLAAEISISSKDMLRALRELQMPARSTSGSVGMEDAARLREYFAASRPENVERTTVQPNVIVRRRRKEQSAPVKPEPAPVVEADAPKPVETPAAELEIPKVEPPKPESTRNREPARSMGARVISRPTVEKPAPQPEPKAEQVALPASEPDVSAEEATPKEPKKTIAQEIREKEAAELAAARAEKDALKKKIQRVANIISKPEVVVETPLTEKIDEGKIDEVKTGEEKASKNKSDKYIEEKIPEEETQEALVRISPVAEAIGKGRKVAQEKEKPAQEKPAEKVAKPSPDASAKPSGSSAPTIATPAEDEAKIPRVRVISRPSAPAPSSRRQRPAAQGGRPGDSASYRPEQRPGSRSGPARPGGQRQAYDAQGLSASPQQLLGQSPDGRDGQSKKKRLKGRRTVDFQQGDFGRHPEDEESARFTRGKARRKAPKPQVQPQVTQPIKAAKRKIRVAEAIRVADMAHQMGVKANEIIKILFGLGVMATINQALDIDTATLVASEFGYEVEKAGFSEEDYLGSREEDSPESLKSRPPVVTIMGHVDHGKTSLLDAVRKSNITSGEAGGITQHIGAYYVKTKRGEIVFLDTPGHEAFTAMRARGAQITDLVILVVAADDGVMEQTREAINHSRAADVPIMVAVNKMDKPGADPDRVLRELAELGLQPEDWGGDTIVARVSAKTREGIDDLLELVALQSEIMDLKANPDKAASGRIVEARLDKGRGPIATVLIQEGTLHAGDTFVCGPFAGRVRALTNDQGKKVKEAGPSIPVEVQGFDGVPEAGEEFMVVADEKMARRIADSRAIKRRERDLASESRVTLETFLAQSGDEEAQTLNLVLKADVQGSLEAITDALMKQGTDKVKINVVHAGTGAISESDILLATASKAIIIGFNIRPTSKIKDIAEHENVDIRYYDIIYKLVDDVKSAMAGMLAPVQREVYLGQAEVRKVYNLPKIGAIAGSYVADGKIARNAGARLLRDGVVAYTGKIASLKRFKEDAREVVKGNECGIGLENFNDIKEGDVIEAFETVEEAATL